MWLRDRRKSLGIGQLDLSSESGLSQATISQLERGDVGLEVLAFGRVVNLTRALGWTLADLERRTGNDFNVGSAESEIGDYVTVVVPLLAPRGERRGDTVAVVVPHHLQQDTLLAFRVWAQTVHKLSPGVLVVVQRAERVRRGQVVLVELHGARHVAYAVDSAARRVKVLQPVEPGGPLVFEPDALIGRFVTVQTDDQDMDAPDGFL
ncbi:MAG TPA: helix-turn-helix transcriptional regulator [Deinococcales bacterium]|nr:helix-turn-helix transcriptional regulator [Deinococcales bacterium]